MLWEMIWLQGGICFVFWIAFGLLIRRHSDRLRDRMASQSRGVRVALGSVVLLGSAALLFGGLYAIYALGGLVNGQLTLWAVPCVLIFGLFFIYMQILAAAAMITLVQADQETIQARTASNDNSSSSDSHS